VLPKGQAGRHVVGRLFLCFYSNNKLLLVVESIAYWYNMLFHSNFKVSFVSWAMTQFIHSHLAFFSRFPSSPERQGTFYPHAHTVRNVITVSLQTKWKILYSKHTYPKNDIFQGNIFLVLLYFLCGAIQARTPVLFYRTVCACNSDYVASIVGLLVHNEMEINWKQALVTSSKYHPDIFMDVLRKTMRRFNHNI